VRKKFDKSNKAAVENRSTLESLRANRGVATSRDMEKLQNKTRAAEERFSVARQTFRQQEETLKNLHTKYYSQELPRIMSKLQQQEVHRSREALSFILAMIELERRCAIMNENYASDMAGKLKRINLVDDEQKFTNIFMSVPLVPPQLPIMTVVSNPKADVDQQASPLLSAGLSPVPIANAEIPRTLSMPPAYESQASATPNPAPYQGAASFAALSSDAAEHRRTVTYDAPSVPAC